MSRVLENLEPKAVFHFFEDLTRIPHGSRNTKAISDYCVSFAKERGLWVYQDALNNVIIKKPASAGYEASPAVILQGHLDMVAEKTPESPIDFTKDALELRIEGDYVSANGTTLGGDDGIAVAMALAVLDSDVIAHPALEVVFTVDEEIGMEGAQGLDFTQLSARRMLNVDSEDEGIFTVSCAGGASANVSIGLTSAPCALACAHLTVSGLIGGHSGQEIDKGRANANLLLGRVLDAMQKKLSYRLVSAAGGLKDNAIPNASEAVLALREEDLSAAREIAAACEADFRKEYAAADPGVTIALELAPACEQALTEGSDAARHSLPAARAERHRSYEHGHSGTGADVLQPRYFPCGGWGSDSGQFGQKFRFVAEADAACPHRRAGAAAGRVASCDGRVSRMGIPARVPAARQACRSLYPADRQGTEDRSHSRGTGMRPVCRSASRARLRFFGPDLVDIHTTREKMSISSVQRTWQFLLGALAALKD